MSNFCCSWLDQMDISCLKEYDISTISRPNITHCQSHGFIQIRKKGRQPRASSKLKLYLHYVSRRWYKALKNENLSNRACIRSQHWEGKITTVNNGMILIRWPDLWNRSFAQSWILDPIGPLPVQFSLNNEMQSSFRKKRFIPRNHHRSLSENRSTMSSIPKATRF